MYASQSSMRASHINKMERNMNKRVLYMNYSMLQYTCDYNYGLKIDMSITVS